MIHKTLLGRDWFTESRMMKRLKWDCFEKSFEYYLMKIAVLADIHGNLPALETVIEHIDAWRPDKIVVGGDVVNRGPKPRECLEIVHRRQIDDGWSVVRGNHEDYVLDQMQPDAPHDGPEFEIAQNGVWTLKKLGDDVSLLEEMPFQVQIFGPDGGEVRVVHGSMRGNRDGIFPKMDDETLRQQIDPAPVLLCAGHTHWPLIREIDQTLVVNVGSVGLPFDGDSRAAYAQLAWKHGLWQASIIRLVYDQAQAEQDYFTTDFISEAGDLARIMLVEFRQARSHIHRWSWEYEDEVRAGTITLANSVQAYLASIDS